MIKDPAIRKARLERVDVSAEQAAVIHRRVRGLLRPDRALIDLMGDAYVQGLSDAANLPQEAS